MYYSLNCKESTAETPNTPTRMNSGTLYEIISKYLNVAQIYIDGKAFVVQNTTYNFEKLVDTITSAISEQN